MGDKVVLLGKLGHAKEKGEFGIKNTDVIIRPNTTFSPLNERPMKREDQESEWRCLAIESSNDTRRKLQRHKKKAPTTQEDTRRQRKLQRHKTTQDDNDTRRKLQRHKKTPGSKTHICTLTQRLRRVGGVAVIMNKNKYYSLMQAGKHMYYRENTRTKGPPKLN